MLILRLSQDHIVLNSLSLGGSALDLAHDVVELSSGKIIVIGATESTDGLFHENQGDKDIVIAQFH